MAGYTDAAARQLYLEGGACLAFTEMVSAEALVRNSDRTRRMARRARGETLLAVQLFGSDPKVMGRAAAALKDMGASLLDVNAACPVPKVVKKGAGAALARDARRLYETVAAMRETGLPVTVKLRSGWQDGRHNFMEAAAAAVSAGASAVALHPRSRSQGYSGRADWSLIRTLAGSLRVPVIGSGDLNSPQDALRMLQDTGCAGLMFARGAVGQPDIFARTVHLLRQGRPLPAPGREVQLKTALRHLQTARELFGEKRAFLDTKKHLSGYIKGWESAVQLRKNIMRAPDMAALTALLRGSLQEKGPISPCPAPSPDTAEPAR